MRVLLTPVVPLFVGLAILLLGHGLLYTLLPIGLLARGMPPQVAAYVASVYFLGMMIGVLIGRRVIERVGHVRAFAPFAAVAASVTLAFPLLVGAVHWIALRLLFGICMAGILMTAESWLNASAPNDPRGRMLSLYMITTYLSMGSGQFLLSLYDPVGFELFSLAAMLLAVTLVPISLTRRVSPQIERRPFLSPLRLYRISPLSLVGTFAAGWMLGPFYGLAPIFASKVGEGALSVGTFMAAAIFAGLLMQWPIGRLSDRYDRRTVLIATAATASVVAVFVVVGSVLWPAAALAGAFLVGGVILAVYPLSVGHINDFLETGDLVQASGGLIITFSAGAILGPIAAAAAMDLVGPNGLFVHIGGAALALAGYGVFRATRRAAVPSELQEPFAAHMPTSPVAAQLGPDSEWTEAEIETPAELADQAAEAAGEKPSAG